MEDVPVGRAPGRALTDKAGAPLELYDHVTRSAYISLYAQLREIAAFVCRSRPELAPITLEERVRGARETLSGPDCLGDAHR